MSQNGQFGKPGRIGGWAFLLVLAVPAMTAAGEFDVRFPKHEPGKPLVVEVHGLPAAALERLKIDQNVDWSRVLSVRVAGGRTPLSGAHSIAGDVIRFESRHAPAAGLTFDAAFDPAALPGKLPGRVLTARVTLAKSEAGPKTRLTALYPTGDQLAENHLRFYLHFSAPMSRGDAYRYVHLIGPDGKEVAFPFLELGEELWDPTGTRFTLLFHPGRVKRGLKPREELGPVLEEGKRYSLMVDAEWPDAAGRPLQAPHKKSFRVIGPDDTPPDPTKWKLTAPAAGTREPLALDLIKPLDHAMLQRVFRVVNADGAALAGRVAVPTGETSWTFTPNDAWRAGDFRLLVDTSLEDRSGNSIARPFELDLVQPRPAAKAREVELKFTVR